jgi:hypothetical protein
MNDDIKQQFPYQCQTEHPYTDVVPWCEQQFGKFNVNWYRYGTDIAIMGIVAGVPFYDYYRFVRKEDAVLFALRWS